LRGNAEQFLAEKSFRRQVCDQRCHWHWRHRAFHMGAYGIISMLQPIESQARASLGLAWTGIAGIPNWTIVGG